MHCVTSTGQLLECLSWDKTSGRERSGTRTGERKWERRSREKREGHNKREAAASCVLLRLAHRRGSQCQGNIWLLRAVASVTSSWLAVSGKYLAAACCRVWHIVVARCGRERSRSLSAEAGTIL